MDDKSFEHQESLIYITRQCYVLKALLEIGLSDLKQKAFNSSNVVESSVALHYYDEINEKLEIIIKVAENKNSLGAQI